MDEAALTRAAEAVIAAGALGRSDVLRRLFDFLLQRSLQGAPPKETEVAHAVFAGAGGQDASVRVYIHRLRQKLSEHYAAEGATDALQLEIPKGEYRLVLRGAAAVGVGDPEPARRAPPRLSRWAVFGAALVGLNLALWVLWWSGSRDGEIARERASAPWSSLLAPARPITLVIGDYYIFGEVDPTRRVDRLVREYAINNALELDDYRMRNPQVRSSYTDLDLYYLPVGTADALRNLMPLLAPTARDRERVRVVMASDLTADMLRRSDIVYLGYLSGLGLLRDPVFAGSRFTVGETWDVLIDQTAKKRYASQEGGPANPGQQSDLGYISAFRGPGGNRIVILAGARDMGLAQISEEATSPTALAAIRKAVGGAEAFEALYEVQGFQRRNVGGRLAVAAPLRTDRIWSAGEAQTFPKG